ncbi:RNA-binding S4 domain-containing protein [Paracrocinitomix mangrovi]|uniref:RNA-binding S4 domain-containing protein n=1 Tax=Paracrocinitomix mangrovi TaxID=2862509 RepID=UPI001C8D1082|nr:RNA-binding S4 domain-containing protein [Paracrocinitomix mangrovi]UKN02917.1 RNA-binding S4 domain-containing protein [Paracrocinitomix mangrovi]
MNTNRTFELRDNQEFIELNKLLKVEQIAQTGGHAKILIAEGSILVNEEVENRVRRKLREGDKVAFDDIIIEITRA